jgi:hypothetical protein
MASWDRLSFGLRLGQVSALINVARNVGSMGVSLAQNVLAHRQQSHQSRLIEHVIPAKFEYQETPRQATSYFAAHGSSVFSLFVRKLPLGRNYLIACGVDDVLHSSHSSLLRKTLPICPCKELSLSPFSTGLWNFASPVTFMRCRRDCAPQRRAVIEYEIGPCPNDQCAKATNKT